MRRTLRYVLKYKGKIALFAVSAAAFVAALIFGAYVIMGPDKWIILGKVPGPIRRAGRIVVETIAELPYLPYAFRQHDLPVYDIRIAHDDWERIQDNLPGDTTRIITDEYQQYYPAVFVADGRAYDADIRIRGNGRNHWLWPKKSYRIRFDDSDRFEGYAELNFIVPLDRLYFVEELNNYRAKKLGLTVPRTEFVVLTINGKHPAVYWQTEQWGKDFLERHKLSSDANFYSEAESTNSLYENIESWKKYNEDTRFGQDNYGEINRLVELLADSSDEVFYRHIFSLIDENSFYAWAVHNLIVFGEHQDWSHNMNLYFDSSIGKFRFFPWDVLVKPANKEDTWLDHLTNPLANRLLANPDIMYERNRRLWEYIGDDANAQAELDFYDALYNRTKTAFYQDTMQRHTNRQFDAEVARWRSLIADNIAYLRGLFRDVVIDSSVVPEGNAVEIMLKIRSLSPVRVELVKLEGLSGASVVWDGIPCVLNDEAYVCDSAPMRPVINYLHLPIPENEPLKTADYYRAFRLGDTRTQVIVRAGGSADFSDMHSVRVSVRNEYTGEGFEYAVPMPAAD